MKVIDSTINFFDFFNERSSVPKFELIRTSHYWESPGDLDSWSIAIPNEHRPEGIKMAYFGHVKFDWKHDVLEVNMCKWVWEKFPIKAILDEFEVDSGMTVRLILDSDF